MQGVNTALRVMRGTFSRHLRFLPITVHFAFNGIKKPKPGVRETLIVEIKNAFTLRSGLCTLNNDA
jgi:hypothetical protein